MSYDFSVQPPKYIVPPILSEVQVLNAGPSTYRPPPPFTEEEEPESPPPLDDWTGWTTTDNYWSNPTSNWPTWAPLLTHTPYTIEHQYPTPPPSPKPDPQVSELTTFPLNPIHLVYHYLFDSSLSDYTNIQQLKNCSTPILIKLVIRHTFFNPQHAAPLCYGLKLLLDLPFTPYIRRRIRHKGRLHEHFAPYSGDPFCTCSCCRFCPLHATANVLATL